jgi:uncharacterized damage-inducible protein DinB
MTITELLVDQMARCSKAFLKALDEYPEHQFSLEPTAGGHSAAWHALHIADWTRVLVPANLENLATDARFGYLGWESADFSKNVFGDSPAMHTDPKATVLDYLRSELERAASDVQNAQEAQLESKIIVPMGERKVLANIQGQIQHVPYHYGQVRLIAKQWGRAT